MRKNKTIKFIVRTLSVVLSLWLLLLIALQVLLKSSVLTTLVDRFAARAVDGDVSYAHVSVNVVKSFPNLNVTIDTLSLTYPHDRWSACDRQGPYSPLLKAGRGTEKDTLISFNSLSASVDYVALLRGKLHSRGVRLSGLRLFAHQYGDGQANWQVFRLSGEETQEDKEEAENHALPSISVGRIVISGHPVMVYTNQEDTVSAMLRMNRLVIHGDLDQYIANRKESLLRRDSLFHRKKQSPLPLQPFAYSPDEPLSGVSSSLSLHLDSLLVSGRIPSDTVILFVNQFDVRDRNSRIAFEMDGRTVWLSEAFGRMRIPVELSGEVGVTPDLKDPQTLVCQLRRFNGSVAYIPLAADAVVRKSPDSLYMDIKMKMDDCPLGEVLRRYGEHFNPALSRVSTDARFTLSANCNGYLNAAENCWPTAGVHLSLPASYLVHDRLPDTCRVALRADASLSEKGRVDASLSRLMMDANGLKADFSVKFSDLTGRDPLFSLSGEASADLQDLKAWLPDSIGEISASGGMTLSMEGTMRRSQMNAKGLPDAQLKASLKSDRMDVNYPKIGLVADIDTLSLTANTMKGLVDTASRALGMVLNADTLAVSIGENLSLKSAALTMMANLSPKRAGGDVMLPQFKGKLKFNQLILNGMDSMRAVVRNMDNTFTIERFVSPSGSISTPRLSLNSETRRMSVRSGGNRAMLGNVGIRLSATKRVTGHFSKEDSSSFRPRFSGSDARVGIFSSERQLPDFMTEKEFEKGDIDLQVGESVKRLFEAWYPSGTVSIDHGALMTPVFPLRNRLDTLRLKFTGNSIAVENFNFRTGKSHLRANGSLSGLRRAILNHGTLHLDMDVESDRMEIDELLLALNRGRQLSRSVSQLSEGSTMQDASDEEYMEALLETAGGQPEDSTASGPLLVVPANLRANVRLRADSVLYSNLIIDTLKGAVVSERRCLQLTGWKALSNMGNIYMDAFYSTRTRRDIMAGFDLKLQQITADEVISLIPVVDSVMPVLKSFKGDLNCEFTATTRLDTMMNLVLPSLSGVFKINGTDLMVEESETVRKITRLLLFRKKWSGKIDDMQVYGMVSDNTMEVFPFILNADRYTLALEGRQQIGTRFDYYFSVISSPVPFQFGIDLYGNSFDRWKFGLGPTKYTHSYHIPLFREEVDSVQVNLVSSIRAIFEQGVDNAVRRSESSGRSMEALRSRHRSEPALDDERNRELMERYRRQEESSLDSVQENGDVGGEHAHGDGQ